MSLFKKCDLSVYECKYLCLYTVEIIIRQLCCVYLLLGRSIEQFGYNLLHLYFKIMYVMA